MVSQFSIRSYTVKIVHLYLPRVRGRFFIGPNRVKWNVELVRVVVCLTVFCTGLSATNEIIFSFFTRTTYQKVSANTHNNHFHHGYILHEPFRLDTLSRRLSRESLLVVQDRLRTVLFSSSLYLRYWGAHSVLMKMVVGSTLAYINVMYKTLERISRARISK